jgi:protein KRI1
VLSLLFPYPKTIIDVCSVKAKYGSDYDPDAAGSDISTDSESAESEDEHGEELTPAVDAAILRTLARIKKKDPAIYDSEKNIFGGLCAHRPCIGTILMIHTEEQEKIGTSGSTQTKTKTKVRAVTNTLPLKL